MKNIKLDSILLFALVIPFIMTYRLSSGETPYWFFGLIFLSLLSYLILDLLLLPQKIYLLFKQVILWFVIISVIGSAFVSTIIVRHQTAPIYMVHDIVLQQESAIRFLLDGKNPYAVTYFGTPLEQWNYSSTETNPALFHFVMQPFYLLFALPFYFLSLPTLGFFDGRMPLLFLFFLLLIIAGIVVKDKEKRLLFLTILAFNPAMLGYTLEGRSDIFMFSFLFFGFFLLQKKRYLLAGIPIALAFAVKQSVWPLMPFYIAFLYFNKQHLGGGRRTPLRWILAMTPFILTFAIIVLPFFFWDQKAFFDSTVSYLSGSTSHSYPISGYGFSMMLYSLGVIKNLHEYYPFFLWQLVIGIPLMILLVIFLKRSPSVGRLMLIYGIFLFVFWYFSRYFNNSHLAYLSMVFITAYFFPVEKS